MYGQRVSRYRNLIAVFRLLTVDTYKAVEALTARSWWLNGDLENGEAVDKADNVIAALSQVGLYVPAVS